MSTLNNLILNGINPNKKRCSWVNLQSPLSVHYHDSEWSIPVFDDTKLFEFLILEGAQAGLSWECILNKRENYRTAFDNFNPQKIAKYTDTKIAKLMSNAGIIRNKRKIESTIKNAQVFLQIQKKHGSFAQYLWLFVGNTPHKNHFTDYSQAPTQTELSVTISKALKAQGMNFIGPTIMYAYMQAVGLVNDHQTNCFLY